MIEKRQSGKRQSGKRQSGKRQSETKNTHSVGILNFLEILGKMK